MLSKQYHKPSDSKKVIDDIIIPIILGSKNFREDCTSCLLNSDAKMNRYKEPIIGNSIMDNNTIIIFFKCWRITGFEPATVRITI